MSGYNELFPSDLQDVLLYLNDDIPDEDKDNAWREYEADCEYETINLEIEDYGSYENKPALAADIDADGEKEYIFSVSDGGTAHYIRTIVAKSIDGEWLVVGGLTSGNSSVRALLEYENQYYLLMGDNLTFWNNEAEMPDWKESLIPGQEECWNLLSIEKNVTGYTPIQVYGNSENETIDYLENVDFGKLYDYAAENTDFISWDFLTSDYWEGENHSFRFQLSYAWAEMKGEEEYQYIVSEITGGTNYQNDLLLTVCRCTAAGETEVAALYYLCADYEVEFSLYEHLELSQSSNTEESIAPVEASGLTGEADDEEKESEDIADLFGRITEDMLNACDTYPDSEAYWNDSLVLLSRFGEEVRLYGISAGEQTAMVLYAGGEKVLMEYPFRNFYQERQKLNVCDLDCDGADEVIISSRTYTGSIRRYALWVCDREDQWNIYMYEDYPEDIINIVHYTYDDANDRIIFLDADDNVLWEGELPEWADDYPYTGVINFEDNMEFDAGTMQMEVIPQIEMENSLPYEPVRIVFDIGFCDGDFVLLLKDVSVIG